MPSTHSIPRHHDTDTADQVVHLKEREGGREGEREGGREREREREDGVQFTAAHVPAAVPTLVSLCCKCCHSSFFTLSVHYKNFCEN